MTSPRTTEWAEHCGREAVRLGFVEWLKDFECLQIAWLHCYDAELPNLAHVHTELAVIPWVQAVAREMYGDVAVLFDFDRGRVGLTIGEKVRLLGRCFFDEVHPTLAEAAISALAAMRGEA